MVLPFQGPGALAESAPRTSGDYPWLEATSESQPPRVSLKAHFPPPPGFERVANPEGSYASWLRGLPVRTDRTEVLSYSGQVLSRPSAAVLLLDVGDRNLMQCADSVIRLHAEYLWSRGRADEAGYRFTSGDLSRWTDWQQGERFVIEGNKVKRVQGKARSSNHGAYRRWLDLIFTYAGTSSLARDVGAPPLEEQTQAGDFFVDPGFPGHAVIILDIAEDREGQRLALVAQGFMPAEEVHVLESSHATGGHWFPLPSAAGDRLDTPSWTPFPKSARRRFP